MRKLFSKLFAASFVCMLLAGGAFAQSEGSQPTDADLAKIEYHQNNGTKIVKKGTISTEKVAELAKAEYQAALNAFANGGKATLFQNDPAEFERLTNVINAWTEANNKFVKGRMSTEEYNALSAEKRAVVDANPSEYFPSSTK